MSAFVRIARAATLAFSIGLCLPAQAAGTLTWSSASDFLTMDPHAQSVTINNTGLGQMYEPLVSRDDDLKLTPGLAESWKAVDDTTWEFKLRKGVKFHDGKDFTADDAVFSLMRAKAPTSDYKVAVSSIAKVEKVDDGAIRIITSQPSSILPEWLTTIFILSKPWAEEHNVVTPQDFKNGQENFAARNVNGIGPYMLKERVPEVQTVMVANPNYWNRREFPVGYDTLVHKPVKSAPTRVAGLLSGDVDFILDPPLQDLARVEADAKLKVEKSYEIRTMFLGFDVTSDKLKYGGGTDKNPFADKRVRQAVYQAINVEGVRRQILRNLSVPAGSIFPPRINGYRKELDDRLPFDVDAAVKLMKDAGFEKGFTVQLDCTNNTFMNDEAVCQAFVPMLARIGIKAEPNLRPASQGFAAWLRRETSMFMLGFGVPTLDAEYLFRFLLHTPDGTLGTWNFGNYSNKEIDKLIDEVAVTIDKDKRDAKMKEVIDRTRDDFIYVPLHHEGLAWAMKKSVGMKVRSDNKPQFKYAKPL